MANPPATDVKAWPLFRTLQGATLAGLGPDLAAGLTLAAIAIPEQMATARLGGMAPTVGLVAFVAATLGFVVFGASRRLSAGADSTITPIFAGSLAALATVGSPHYAVLAAALALLVGVIVAVSGLLKLGWIADFLSRPVITGFLAGIALHIALNQAPALLGLPEESGDVYHRLVALGRQIGGFNPAALAIGVGVFAVTLGAEKLNPRIPGALIALVGATLATIWLGLAKHGVAVLGASSGGLPPMGFPVLGLETAVPLVGLAGVIALVVMVQTAVTSRAYPDDGEADVDRDFVGVGVGGVLAALAGAFPVNASPPRTAAVAAAGGRTQFGGLAAALGVLLLAAFGTGLMAQTPSAALAGVLLFVAQRIFHLDDLALLPADAGRVRPGAADHGADRAAADPDRGGHRHVPVADPRRLHHHPGAADPVPPHARHHDLVAGRAGPSGRNCSRRTGARLSGAAVIPQRLRLPPRRVESAGGETRRAEAGGAGVERHRRDRLHRRGDPQRGDRRGSRPAYRLRGGAA